ncbi:hypothetical protein BJF78_14400 [Pseudonocardia sp. CNS-139]|nr:hypothetical protein BJF78_14400 [Pseudonocardia sp. CNS-139]
MTSTVETSPPNAITPADLPESLVRGLRGAVHGPGTAAFDRIRTLHNAMIDRSPGVIVECAGPGDIRDVLLWASTENQPVAVRAGGHNVAGNALNDGGLVLDVSSMQGAHVDPERRVVRVQPGVTWGGFDRETQAFALATTGGNISSTGVAGLTLGGGIGWLMRRFGLTCDSLAGADVLTPDGRFVRAGDDGDPELLWALRGGGGNFGVVTAFDFALHPFDHECVTGVAIHPFEAAADLAGFVAREAAQRPTS